MLHECRKWEKEQNSKNIARGKSHLLMNFLLLLQSSLDHITKFSTPQFIRWKKFFKAEIFIITRITNLIAIVSVKFHVHDWVHHMMMLKRSNLPGNININGLIFRKCVCIEFGNYSSYEIFLYSQSAHTLHDWSFIS